MTVSVPGQVTSPHWISLTDTVTSAPSPRISRTIALTASERCRSSGLGLRKKPNMGSARGQSEEAGRPVFGTEEKLGAAGVPGERRDGGTLDGAPHQELGRIGQTAEQDAAILIAHRQDE